MSVGVSPVSRQELDLASDGGGRPIPGSGRDILLFLALTVLVSAIAYVPLLTIDPSVSARRHYIVLLMWSPAVAALLACRLRGSPMSGFGWAWPGGRWVAVGYLLPIAYAGAAYALIWSLGFGEFAPADRLQRLAASYGWTEAHPLLLVLGTMFIKASAGLVIAASSALGEEIGWRGCLAPRLAGRMGAQRGALLLGLIWLTWHVPLMIAGGYNNGTEWWFGLACFAILVIAGSVVSMWLRLASASLWPCVAWHASHNLYIQSVFDPLTGARGELTEYMTGEFGLVVPVMLLLLSFPLFRKLAYVRTF